MPLKELTKSGKKFIWVGIHSTTDRETDHDCCQQHFYGSSKKEVLKLMLKFFEAKDYFEHYDYMCVKNQLENEGYFWFFEGVFTANIEKRWYE